MERNVYAKYPNLGVSLLMVIDVALFGIVGMSVWAVQMMWIPFWAGGVVNGAGHFWGYRNFGTDDASTNLIPVGVLIGGEELHNNHHAYATSAKLSSKWYELDIGWTYICIFSALGLAKAKKVASTPHRVKGKVVLDDDTLQAILRNRYEVMAGFARAAERACREEIKRMGHASRRERHLLMRGAKMWLRNGLEAQRNQDRLPLPAIYDHNQELRACMELSGDLSAMWERSNASREQLLSQLQDWCCLCEQSGINALREFSLTLRQYT
jgi:stearoyl-CoA desaturase (delta-9 desaturase)